MKITNISCTQFAGVGERNMSFTDGVNVIYGKNESGKSTMVNLLSRTLFQNARIDGRKDKEFKGLYFPGARKDSKIKGDFIDGKVIIETESGAYKLEKEWGEDSFCKLHTPDGVISDQEQIDEILRELLIYGEGVYNDILFSSQRNTDVSLQTILDASKNSDAKQEIINVVSQAFAESDGISVDLIEQEINAKIEEIAGKHWDSRRKIPDRKSDGKPWKSGLGEILDAYYKLENAEKELSEIYELESKAIEAADEYKNKDDDYRRAEKKYENFNTYASRLATRKLRKDNIELIKTEIQKKNDDLGNWPTFTENIKKAKALQFENENREVLDKYGEAKAVNDTIEERNSRIENLICPTDDEIEQVKGAENKLNRLENQLCGMNLTAVINMIGNNNVEITSLRTGEAVDISGGTASVTEAVKITVPGVMEMQLSPADVDVVSVEEQVSEQKCIIDDIFAKHKVGSLKELEEIRKSIINVDADIEHEKNKLNLLLGSVSFEELKSKAEAITEEVRSKEEIENDIYNLSMFDDISTFIAKSEQRVEDYTASYGSIDELKSKVADSEKKLEKAKKEIDSFEDIPEEYINISDPDAYLEKLQNDRDLKREKREDALNSKADAESKFNSYKEKMDSDPEEKVEEAKRIFEEKQSLLSHWQHIKEVFDEQKEMINTNPMQDIADRLAEYLGIISESRISSEFPEANRLDMEIYSDNRLLDYAKLSEGTKETVSLAFRLAVLDHLFPEGGGVIVFDDPLTDMDADRAAQSCELIKACAARHQVIFLTCREEYIDMLSGNEIRL